MPLYVDDGPEELGAFGVQRATIDGAPWVLDVDAHSGATATTTDGRVFGLNGKLTGKSFTAELDGLPVRLINEKRNDWIVETTAGEDKIAQFSGGNHGARKSILELEEGTQLNRERVAALSWYTRLILEAKLQRTSTTLTVVLVAASILAVLAFLL